MSVLLPPEIMLQVIHTFNRYAEQGSPIALPPDSITTRTLLALTQTCRLAYPVALRALFTQCCWIDSPSRLSSFVSTIQRLSDRAKAGSTESKHALSGIPPVTILPYIKSLYLAPCDELNLANFSPVELIYILLPLLAPRLRRLVVDIPFRRFRPSHELVRHRKILTWAFAKLTKLEIFCSARDEFLTSAIRSAAGIDFLDLPVWSQWSNLQILALYNVDPSNEFWSRVCQLKKLNHLILTRADGLNDIESIDLVTSLKEQWPEDAGPLRVTLVNTYYEDHVINREPAQDNSGRVAVNRFYVPTGEWDYRDDDIPHICQEYIRDTILDGKSRYLCAIEGLKHLKTPCYL